MEDIRVVEPGEPERTGEYENLHDCEVVVVVVVPVVVVVVVVVLLKRKEGKARQADLGRSTGC